MPMWIPPMPPRDDRPAGEKGFVSLRDTFAAAALTGFIRGIPSDSIFHLGLLAQQSYEVANAMLRERGNYSEKPNSSTNHDAVPEAKDRTAGELGGARVTGNTPTLTDEEREAVEVAAAAYAADHGERFAAILRRLLERLHK